MVIRVLAIGDVGSIVKTIQKYVKKSEIHLINYPQDGSGVFTAPDDVELFKTWKVSEHVKKINEIKNNDADELIDEIQEFYKIFKQSAIICL